MLEVVLKDDTIHIGKHFSIDFQRTLRIPDDGNTYPLPPGLGRFPICKVADYKDRVPESFYPDEYGVDTWDENNFGRVYIHIVNSLMYREITGMEPPPTPITAKTYAKYGLPWFDLLDEEKGDIAPSDGLAKIKSIKDMDKEKGFTPQQDDSAVKVSSIKKLKIKTNKIIDGKW